MGNEENIWQELVEAIRAERAAKTKKERERLQKEAERLAAEADKAQDKRSKK